ESCVSLLWIMPTSLVRHRVDGRMKRIGDGAVDRIQTVLRVRNSVLSVTGRTELAGQRQRPGGFVGGHRANLEVLWRGLIDVELRQVASVGALPSLVAFLRRPNRRQVNEGLCGVGPLGSCREH